MRKFWFSPSIVCNGLLWLLGIAMQISGWVNQTIAISLLAIAFLWSIATLIYWLKNRQQSRQRNETKTGVKKEVQLDLVKLFHEGKDVQANLKKVQAQWSASEQVSAELHFEAWFTHVSNTLKNTEFINLWYENKVVNYRKDSISDYIGASERALDRLESIMQLTKEGSQN